MLKVQKNPLIEFLEYHGKQRKKSPIDKRKQNILVLVGCKIRRNDLEDEMHHTSQGVMNEAFFATPMSHRWERCGGLCFTHYTTYVAPNYKSMFFPKHSCSHEYILLESIPFYTILTMLL